MRVCFTREKSKVLGSFWVYNEELNSNYGDQEGTANELWTLAEAEKSRIEAVEMNFLGGACGLKTMNVEI